MAQAPSPLAASGPPVLSNQRQLLAGLVLALSNFMVVLDMTIANVSVPHIAGNLGISLDQGTWIITSYAVAEAICVPLTGWLVSRFGTVRVFVAAMFGFGFFSLLCGFSPTLGMLVACRVGQGFCGAPLMPASQTMMLSVFPPERRGMALAVWAMTTLLAPAFGPIIGGYISDNWSWHWIFLINVPIAALCVVASAILLRPMETPTRKLPIDMVGLGLMVFWIGCLQIMLDIGRERDWFADPMIAGLGVAAFIGFCVFIIWEMSEEHPVVDLRIFRHIGFASSVTTLALCYGAYFAGIVIIPQWLQSSMGYTARDAGIATAFTAMAAFCAAPFVPRLMVKVDPRLLISLGVTWLGIMSLVRTNWTSSADFSAIAWPQFIQGFAMPFFFIPLTQVSLGSVNQDEVASAAGLQNFLRTMASAISTSVVLTIWGNHQRFVHNELANVIQPDATVNSLTASGMGTDTIRAMINNIVDQESTTIALDHTFLISAILLFIAAGMVWLAPRPTMLMEQGAGGH